MFAMAERLIMTVIGVGFAAALLNAWAGPGGVIFGLFAGLVCWAVSLRLKEWQRCPACRGSGKHEGIFARNSMSLCSRCAGTSGRVVRWGVRFLRPARARELMAGLDRPGWRG